MIASSRPPGQLDALPELIAHHTKEIEAAKRTQPIQMMVGKEELIVVAAPFPGQAGEQQAYSPWWGNIRPTAASPPWFRRHVGRPQVGSVPLDAGFLGCHVGDH